MLGDVLKLVGRRRFLA